MTNTTPPQTPSPVDPARPEPAPILVAVIAASVRKDRMSRVLADWAASRPMRPVQLST
jgi:hypothetical protein